LVGFVGIRRRSPCLLKAFYILQSLIIVVSVGLLAGAGTYLAISQPQFASSIWSVVQEHPIHFAAFAILSMFLLYVKLRSIFFARVLSVQIEMKADSVELNNLHDDESDEDIPQQPQMFVVPQPMFSAPSSGQEALYMQIPVNVVPIYVDRSGNYVH